MANSTNETVSLESINCIDHVNHNTVKYGDVFFSENCMMCKCGYPELTCQRIWCPPSSHCNGIVTKDPRHCCDICTPSVILNGSADHAGPSLKLGGMTVTFLILVSTVFFVLHRLRKKRLLITVRRCRSFDGVDMGRYRNNENTHCSQYPTTQVPISRGQFSDLLSSSAYAEPPPSYFTAVRSSGGGQPMNVTVYTVPPPPYFPTNPGRQSSLSDSVRLPPKCQRLQGCHSWPDLVEDKMNRCSLFRNCSDQTVHINSTLADRCYSSTVSNVQTFSSCSSTACSSGCDCRSFSSDDPTSVYFVPSTMVGQADRHLSTVN